MSENKNGYQTDGEKKDVSELSCAEKIAEIDKAIEKVTRNLRLSEEKSAACGEAVVSDSIQKKVIAIVLVMALSVIAFVSTSYAYFTATVSSLSNTIESSKADFEFVDLVYPSDSPNGTPSEGVVESFSVFPGESVRRDVSAVNSGTLTVYVRARVDFEIALSNRYVDRADEIDLSLIILDVNSEYWKTRDSFDGYYYYLEALSHGESTPDFVNGITFSPDMGNMYKGSKIKVKVTFEVVQASGNGTDVFSATGWTGSLEGGDA